MIAPEYFNNHVSVEGEIIVKSVPNDAGFVLVWNPTTKKISRRTHAEIATDLGVVTESSWNNITGKKWFKTDGGNTWDNNTLRIQGINGHDAGLTFFRDGIDVGQLIFDGYFFHTKTADGVGYLPIKSSHFIKNGSDANYVLLGNGDHKSISDFALNSQLNNYVTLNTPQDILARKSFKGGTGNEYSNAAIEILGNGSTIHPSIAFHQPGSLAGVVSYRDFGYCFMNDDSSQFRTLNASGYKKEGSNDFYLLTGGGGHDLKNKYISGDNGTGTIQVYSPDNGLPDNSFKPVKSGFYRPNGENGYGSLLIWVQHVQTNDGTYGAGIAFDYGGTDAYITGIWGDGTKEVNKKIWHEGNFNPNNYWTTSKTVDYLEANYLKLSGGTLTSGGIIKPNGDIIIQQVGGGGNATGIWWDDMADTDRIAGVGALTDNGNLNYLYMGWSNTPWDQTKSFAVNDSFIRYKGNDVWHNGNFNPNTKANALENARGVGFSSGNYPTANGIEYPYMYFDNGSATSYVALATQEFTNANYHKINNGFGLNNVSDSNYNKTWFDYSWAGSGSPGSVINFSGLGGYYATELFGEYGNGGNRFGLRTRNGDAVQWNDPRWIWHSGNFNPSQYVTQSALNSQLTNYATLNGVQTFTNTNTFLQSPVIPNGTINSHAVNVGQLYYNDRTFITDSRGAVRPPSFYDDRFAQWDFQHGNDTQVTGDSWQGVLTVSKWETFDPSHRQEQILFTGDNLKRRTAIDDDTWGPEKTIWDSGNFTPANFATASQIDDKVNKSGDTMSGALNIASNHKIGDWRGITQTGNYLSWLKYDGSKAIAYIGADGGAAIGNGGTGDNFVITSAGGGDLILSSSSGTIQANGQINTTHHGNSSQWQNTSQYALMNRGVSFTSNVDADQISQGTEIISIELPNGSGNTNFPFHDYGTFMRFRANSFTTDFAHAHNSNLWFKNFYNPNGAAGATWRMVWDNQNFNPDSKVDKSGDTMSGALLIGNNNIGKQRVLHLAEPTYLDSYGFNFYTDTGTGLLTLHGLNNGLSNAVPILSANRANNFVGINKENPTTELDVNGDVASNSFIKNNSSDDYFLMGGGGQLTKYSKDDSYVNSGRDFPDGTLITTNIDYSNTEGDSFLLEIKGNMYGGGLPMDTKVQGYIYAGTIINESGYSTYSDLTSIIAININGNLCFWFPRFWYWQGFSVKVIATGGGDITTVNRVISIDNSPEPAGTKQVKIKVYTLSTQTWVNNQGFLTSANLNGYVTQSSLNNQLGNYATLNGVQTFNNTNTFNQSPVIPNGTLGNHAVNLNQLLDVAPPYHWNYVGHSAIANRRVLREMTWNNYGNNHTIFDISSGTTPWGASKSNVDAEQAWSPSYPTLVGGNGSGTYGIRVDSARNADNLGGISAGNYATQTWVNTNYIPRSHPVYNITQANINSWNAGTGGGSSHTHFNLSYLNNIDQWLGVGQAPQFGSIKLMDSLGYGMLALEEGLIDGEVGLVDISNERFYAGRIKEYLKYGSSIYGFEGLNIHFNAQLLSIGREIGNDEDKVQLAGDLSVDTIDIYHDSRQLILNPLYNTKGDVRHSRNAHIYIVTRNTVTLPDKPILGQRIEIFNDSDNYIEVTHSNVGTMFHVPPYCKVTGIAANKGFKFDAKPVETKQYDI